MLIRKVIYNIDYVHILTFKDNYRSIIAPYFSYEPLEYGIDNENTLNESIRLIFRAEGFIFQFRKEGITFIYEGEVNLLKKSNPIVDIFFDILDKIKSIKGFIKIKRHKIHCFAFDFISNEILEQELKQPKFIKSPFSELDDFANILEFKKNTLQIGLKFGNYNKTDIQKFNLSQLNTEYNKELKDKVGYMCDVNITEEISSVSFSKFKDFLRQSEELINTYSNFVTS